ncbi:microtubule-associated serine/threonine-protein kinase 3-like [Engystomops pustulosus]|uniref:microtubule-associated serine/threonine-protein kinase 3-like n=1 Tax=Engystomops pustulosus TaxID=76066 RepID=UPI003AFB8050
MSGFTLDVIQMEAQLLGILSSYSPHKVLIQPDGVLSFSYRLVLGLAEDFYFKCQQGLVTCDYLDDLQCNIQALLLQAVERSRFGDLAFLSELAQKVLDVTGCPAHSLEHQALIRPLQEVKRPCKSDYKMIKYISSGAFGAVYQVRHINTNQIFAMKKLDREKLNARRFERAFLERDILTFGQCPFIVSMFGSFPTEQHLCMAMEYVGGGDCGHLLKTRGPLPVTLARFYFAEVVLGLEYLHSYGVVHRDLKPDNLLITPTGHIKITDVGVAKLGLMRPASNKYKPTTDEIISEFTDQEACGTPYYIAPEVILRKGYGRPIDWWSLGIILHQFIVGHVPFRGKNAKKVYEEIVNDEIVWEFKNDAPPPEVQDVITELLRKNPAHRLGTGGATEIKVHPFLVDINLEDILSQTPEYVPQIMSEMDTSCFGDRSKRHQHMLSEEEQGACGQSNDPEFPSSQRLSIKSSRKMDHPNSPPCCSPGYENKISEMQKESSSEADDDKQGPTANSSSSTLSGFPAQKEKTSAVTLRNHKQSEQSESRARGSIFRRFLSSCRRGLSRVANAMGGGCFSAGSHHL